MLVGKTRTDVDKLWNAFWTGGITNPVSVIEQINYLLFIRRLDDIETRNERLASRTRKPIARRIFTEQQQHLRWSHFKQLKPDAMFKVVQDEVFAFIKELGNNSSGEITTFSKTLSDAVFLIPKSSLLSSAVDLISGLDLDNADTAGDLYEYLLSKLSTSGINGQFRTPRHIIRMMVEMAHPQIGERICDPACGTAGFLFSALQYILEQNTSGHLVQTDENGVRHGFVGDRLKTEQRAKFERDTFYGFDFDPTMLRVASMNMWLHGIESPNIAYADTLSKHFVEQDRYDLILANPPFKGQLDYGDCSPSLLSEIKTKKTELLFLLLGLRLLDIGGRAAIIVPDGVLFGSSNAHVAIRRLLVEDNQLEAVVSMPSGVFRPYAGVSTAVLMFTKGGTTDKVWFYEMEHDGFTLDDKRDPVDQNDIPDVLDCWKNRGNVAFNTAREARLSKLKLDMAPLKVRRRQDYEEIDQLEFESILAEKSSTVHEALDARRAELKELSDSIHTLQIEFNQLSRQFWVEKRSIVENKYDLSASRYRSVERDHTYIPDMRVTLNRLMQLEENIKHEIKVVTSLLS